MNVAIQVESDETASALRHALTALARDQKGDASRLRAATLPLFKQALAQARAGARTFLEGGGTGLGTAQMLSRAQDALIHVLYDFTVKHVFYAQNPTESEHIAVVATGGANPEFIHELSPFANPPGEPTDATRARMAL